MPYVVGTVVLALLGVGLFVWKSKQAEPTATPETAQVATTTATATEPKPLLHAPPPPPPVEEEPAPSANTPTSVKAANPTPAGPGPCGGTCQGTAPAALSSALRGTAQSAQGCYNRALRTSEASGSMTVSVRVGPNGSVCSAQLVNDTVGSSEISSCVLGRFRGKTFPPPSGGCVTVNIPISFAIKQ